MQQNKTENRIIWFICFMLYSGYNAGLSILIYIGLIGYSRYYSIPVRLLMCGSIIYILTKTKIKVNKYFLFFVFFSILYVVKIFYSELTTINTLSKKWYEYIFYYLSFCFLPFMFFYTIDFKKYVNTILNSFISSGFVFSIIIIILYKDVLIAGNVGRLGTTQYLEIYGSETINPLALSYSGALTMSLGVLYLLLKKERSKKQLYYILLAILLSAIIFLLGSSRGAIVALFLSLLIMFFYSGIKNKFKFILLFILSIPLVIYGVERTGSSIIDRVDSTIKEGSNISERERLYLEAYKEFIDNPYLGGLVEVSGVYPHNIFLECLMSVGFIGFILFFLVLAKSFTIAFVNAKNNKIYLIILLILINGLIQHTFSGALFAAALVFVPLGILIGNTKIDKKYK